MDIGSGNIIYDQVNTIRSHSFSKPQSEGRQRSFFLPKDQQVTDPSGPEDTEYEGLAYLGEFPLAWAACLGNETVYNKLIDFGADPDLQDSFGNMILHMVVVCNQLEIRRGIFKSCPPSPFNRQLIQGYNGGECLVPSRRRQK
ncbi:hypothetical protein SK128_019941 [Halocaridina rubra]|uniref:Uncharacterized protein n=1 Tax=Halocaridina rubra TaxID=373956 RepID=A0AAN8X693_HALRR